MAYYLCRRCLYRTCQKTDMKRHLERLKKCFYNNKNIFFSDEDLINQSLTRIEINDIDQENGTKNLNENVQKSEWHTNYGTILHTNNAIKNGVKDSNDYVCNLCNKKFSRKSSVKRHMEGFCKTSTEKSNSVKPTINNIINQNNTINNNIQINLNLNKITPFDDDWNTSHLDEQTKVNLLLSSIKFTKTIEKILENDSNLNVLINKDKNTGLVYKNDIEKFKPMDVNDIIDKSMNKIYNHIKQFSEDIRDKNDFNFNDKIFDSEINMIEDKYEDYQNNKVTQKNVQNHMIEIYDKNKEKTYNTFCTIEQKYLNNKIIGF